jgi:hypothetical protein
VPRCFVAPLAWPLIAIMMILAWQATSIAADLPSGTAETPPAKQPDEDRVDFPGIKIDRKRRCVDIEATVCLDEGSLELIACTSGTKEHESIVAVKARPKHVHLGLLLIGARNGKPAMRKVVEGEGASPRWIDIPPSGDPINAWLVFENAAGQVTEHPISDFLMRTGPHEASDEADSVATQDAGAAPAATFPDTFIFAGSHVVTDDEGKSRYLADAQGNVITISTFGDEVLCLPGWYSHDNQTLTWQVNPAKLPKVGSKVTLRLRPKSSDKPAGAE